MSKQDTQLINVFNYNPNNMIFAEPVQGSIPDSKPAINFKRINIYSRNPDGSTGELVIPTSRLFSFGVTENKSQETGKVNGWTFPLCLWSRDGATEEEKAWTDTFNAIVEQCTEHILNTKEELDKWDLDRNDLKKFNPLYWRREKKMVGGKSVFAVVDGVGPTLYSKLIYSKKSDKFLTRFYDSDGSTIDPIDMLGKYCYTRSVVKIESIFIGTKISLQVKLYESDIEFINTGMKRLISRPQSNPNVTAEQPPVLQRNSNGPLNDDDSIEDDGSLVEEEDEIQDKKPPAKRRIVRKAK